MKAGFIGLGHLGKALATRLISEGVRLTVWNRTEEKARGLGVDIAQDPASLVSGSDLVFLNLFDSRAVKEVMEGPKGLLGGDCKGKIIIDTTTNHFDSVEYFYKSFEKKGATYLESPVLGSVVPALQGNLTVLVSGKQDAFKTAKPLLEKLGKDIFFLEKPALATKMKLINNLLLGTFMASIAEATVMSENAGLDKKTALEIFSRGAGNSAVLNAKKEKLINEDFEAHFKTSLIYKDLHYLQDLAKALNKPLFTGSLAKELFALAVLRGSEDLDFSAIYSVIKGL